MNIIKVPSVFSVKLPGGEWLNLALIRRLLLEEISPPRVAVTWENGEKEIYIGEESNRIGRGMDAGSNH